MTALRLPELHFSVQYGVDIPELSRQQLRAWAMRALRAAYTRDELDFESAELTLRFVEKDEAQSLNQTYRDKDYAPNVLTFEYGVDPLGTIRGDIIICWPVLQEEAQQQAKPLKNHAAHLVIHGVLHALGYDHLDDEQAQDMESLEITVLEQLSMPNPYL